MVQRAVPPFELPVDELTLPGESPFERIDGKLIPVAPAEEPHSQTHSDLVSLLRAHAAPGYQVGLDMLTRVAVDSEVAPDACVYPIARDANGRRQLEELAFEVMDTERRSHAARKAQLLVGRGVRRMFAIDLRWSQVLEWDRALGDWRLLPPGSTIEDACLVRPLATNALRGIGASDEVVAGWVSQGHPVLRREIEREAQLEVERAKQALMNSTESRDRSVWFKEGELIGREQALREAVVDLAELLGLEVSAAQRAALADQGLEALEVLRRHLKQHRAWPAT